MGRCPHGRRLVSAAASGGPGGPRQRRPVLAAAHWSRPLTVPLALLGDGVVFTPGIRAAPARGSSYLCLVGDSWDRVGTQGHFGAWGSDSCRLQDVSDRWIQQAGTEARLESQGRSGDLTYLYPGPRRPGHATSESRAKQQVLSSVGCHAGWGPCVSPGWPQGAARVALASVPPGCGWGGCWPCAPAVSWVTEGMVQPAGWPGLCLVDTLFCPHLPGGWWAPGCTRDIHLLPW